MDQRCIDRPFGQGPPQGHDRAVEIFGAAITQVFGLAIVKILLRETCRRLTFTVRQMSVDTLNDIVNNHSHITALRGTSRSFRLL